MGLSKNQLKKLTMPALLWPIGYDLDADGNDVPKPPMDFNCVIEGTTSTFGTGTEGDISTSTPHDNTTIITDALGIKLGDRVELQVMVGEIALFLGQVKRKVTNVITYRDKTGAELLQEVTITTD